MIVLRLSLLALVATTSLSLAADWERFRGANGFGASDDKDIPVSFKPENTLWKVAIPGKGNSSPIISKGKVFLEASSDEGDKRFFFCLDAATGKQLWKDEFSAKFAKTHEKSSMASSTPAADGKRVFGVFWDGKSLTLVAWDYDGKRLWSKAMGSFSSQHGPGLSPIVIDNHVILNFDQDDQAEVHAYDVKSGNLVWKKSRQAFRASYSTPFLLEENGKKELIVSSTAGITSYDPKDGTIRWNWNWVWGGGGKKAGPGGPLRQVGGPIYHEGMFFTASGDGGGDRRMTSLKKGDSGEVRSTVWDKKKGTPYVPMTLAKDGYLFWVTDKENLAVCVEAKTGKEVWNERLGGGAQVFASPIMIDGKIYSINERGTVFVFAANPTYDLLAKNDLHEDVIASPAVANGRFYVRTAKSLIAIGKKK
jgi:outer membrane protein assembly factor BamB